MRYRIIFQKTDAMRYTSHLDTHRTWERTVRRAHLPLVYSQGFNPRPKINLASALPLGFTSSCEIAEIWLESDLPTAEVENQLQGALTPGMVITNVKSVDPKGPKLPNLVISAEYTITLIESVDGLDQMTDRIRNSDRLIRERRGKKYNLRPLIEEMVVIKHSLDGKQCVRIRLAARTGATGRPDEVLAEMGIPLQKTRIHRTKLVLKNQD